MDFKALIRAREALDGFWQRADLKGRPWGPNRKENPFSCSNIMIAFKDELVSISQSRETQEVIIHQFCRTERTKLGEEIKKVLRQEGISFR